MCGFKCMRRQEYLVNEYKILPFRKPDIFLVKRWRNEQIDILRQKGALSNQDQLEYYKKVIQPSFNQEYPKQILFSFLKKDELIGYGGLVHINWDAKNGEISFLTKTSRNEDIGVFQKDLTFFLKLIKQVAFEELNFLKIYTTAYDLRPYLYPVLEHEGFENEGRLKKHVCIKDKLVDIVTHAYFKNWR